MSYLCITVPILAYLTSLNSLTPSGVHSTSIILPLAVPTTQTSAAATKANAHVERFLADNAILDNVSCTVPPDCCRGRIKSVKVTSMMLVQAIWVAIQNPGETFNR